MRIVCYKQVPIAKLKLPGDIKARMRELRNIEKAETIKQVGVLNAPIIRASDNLFICGRDRVASAIVAELEEIWICYVDCTDVEARIAESTENAHRRNYDASEQQKLFIELVKAQKEYWETVGLPEPKLPHRGRNQSPLGKAREIVAATRGVRPESIRKRQWRIRKKTEEEPLLEEHATPEPDAAGGVQWREPTITTLGVDQLIEPEFWAQVELIQKKIGAMSNKLAGFLSILSALERSDAPFPEVWVTRIREDYQRIATRMRGCVPDSVCPWCKALFPVRTDCTACMGSGWISRLQNRNIPKELLVEGMESVTLVQGLREPVREVLKRRPKPPEPEPLDDDFLGSFE